MNSQHHRSMEESKESMQGGEELTLERMRADVAAVLFMEPDEIGDEDDLLYMGLDSIRLMSLALRWKDAGADLAFADFVQRPVLRHWWALVSQLQADRSGRGS